MEHSSLPPPSPFPAIGRHQRTPSYTRFDVPVDKQLVQRKSSISQHSILAARRLLSDDESLAASNEMINQFLRATGGDREHVRHFCIFYTRHEIVPILAARSVGLHSQTLQERSCHAYA